MFLQRLECLLLLAIPMLWNVLLREIVQRTSDLGEVADEAAVEIAETEK